MEDIIKDYNKFLKNANVPLEILSELMEALRKEMENKGAAEMYEHYTKGEKCDAWTCDPSVVKDFDKRLEEENIQHACVQYTGDSKTVGNGVILVVAKSEDRERVQKVKDAFLKELGSLSKVQIAELKRQNIDGDIHTINGVNKTYATVFQEEAKKIGLAVAITDNKNGTFNVHYSGKDEIKAKPVLMKTIESTRGVTGVLNEHRIELEDGLNKEIYDSVSEPNKEFYIVSATQPNEYMHFTPEGYQHYRNERMIGDELHSNRNFQQDAHNKIDSAFVRPVVLSRDEFERVRELPRQEYKKEIEKRTHKVRHLSSREAHQLELERKARELVELKMSLDNNSLNTNFYNSSVSFNAFLTQEEVTDTIVNGNSDREHEMAVNPKELPADVQITIDKLDSLPLEDQEYIKETIREYYEELRDTEIDVYEVTHEDLSEDLDAVIANLADDRTVVPEDRVDISEERSLF